MKQYQVTTSTDNTKTHHTVFVKDNETKHNAQSIVLRRIKGKIGSIKSELIR